MDRAIVVTGAASGIGSAAVAWLNQRGFATIGVDLAGSDIDADLAHARGRHTMRDRIAARAPSGIAGIVACAGVAGEVAGGHIVAVNYFGAVATFDLLLPLMAGAKRPRAVLIASSALLLPSDSATVEACLAGNEREAVRYAQDMPQKAYASSKLAAQQWMRRAAVSSEWAGRGIALNAVAPGTIRTPITEPFLASEAGLAVLRQSAPTATADFGKPADVAEVIGFLATMETAYLLGQTIFVDGGCQVLLNPDR